MNRDEIDGLRAAVSAYISTHGGLEAFHQKSGVSVDTLRRFREGRNVSVKNLNLIADAADALKLTLRSSGTWNNGTANGATDYRSEVAPAMILASRQLNAVADYLLDPRAKDGDKAVKLLKLCIDVLESYGVKLDAKKILSDLKH